jgi:spore coat protein U-like protein
MVITKMVINLMKQNGCWSSYAAQSLSIQCKWRYTASRKVTVSLTQSVYNEGQQQQRVVSRERVSRLTNK